MSAVVAHCLRSRYVSLGCLVLLAVARVLPPDGLGIPLCQFKVMTHLPCLTCGLTRSVIGVAHLEIARATFFHPLGVVLAAQLTFLAALLPAPRQFRARLALRAENRPRLWNYVGVALLVALLLNGFGRLAWLIATGRPSPW